MAHSAQRYLKRLRRALICPRADRERLLQDAEDMLDTFAQENPGAFYHDYVSSFGPPEDFAAEMLSNLDPEDIAEARSRRKRALAAAVAVVVVALLLLAGFWFGRRSLPPAETPTPAPAATPEPTPEPSPEPTPEEDEDVMPGPSWEDSAAYLESVYTDGRSIAHKQAVAALTSLGLFSPLGDGDFRSDGTLTKGEAAKLMTLLMTGGKDSPDWEPAKSGFTDIWGHWSEFYIDYCAELGIVSSEESELFYPNDETTVIEFIKMGLCALGYESQAFKLNGDDWVTQTDILARTRDPSLYEGLNSVSVNEPITRGDAAQILYNILHNTSKRVAPVARILADGSLVTEWQFVDAPDPLLKDRFDLTWDEISLD